MIDILREPYVSDQRAEIDELKKQIQLLKAELNLLRGQELTIINSLPIMVFVTDLTGKFLFTNKHFCQTLLLENEEVYNLSVKEILEPESFRQLKQLYIYNRKENQNRFTLDLTILRKNGSPLNTSVIFSRYPYAYDKIGILGVGFDKSKDDSKEFFEQSKQHMMRFVSLIAHDLKNPFNSLIGFSNLLLENYDKYSDEKRKEFIHHLYQASSQGSQLLDNLLEWSRVSTGRIDAQPTLFMLNDLIYELINFFESNIVKKELVIETNLRPNTTVYADENMIRTVIRNILSNAIKFSYRSGKIEIKSKKRKKFTVIEITDHGVGMNLSKTGKSFKFLPTVQSTRGTEGEKGTGLGLLICKEFLELNHGKIIVSSKPSQGTTFTLYLPSEQI